MRVSASPTPGERRQRGAIAVVVAFSLVALVLMLGLVLDIGHLYVTKSELQNAADACALSAAAELNDLGTGALDRATAAGITAGNRNRIDLQGVALRTSGEGIVPADVAFSDTLNGVYTRAVMSTTVYARCAPRETNVKSVVLWFVGLVGLTQWDLSAEAVARTTGVELPCSIPITMCTTASPSVPGLGFSTGTWYSGRLGAGTAVTGNYDWIRFDEQGAKSLGEVLAGTGVCSQPKQVSSEPGISGGVAQAWNTRFGLYAGTWKDIDLYPPDQTGFSFTPNRVSDKGVTIPGSWPNAAPQNAYPSYITHEGSYDPYNPSARLDDNGHNANLPGNPDPLATDLHRTKGKEFRRMAMVPVIGCSSWAEGKKNIPVVDYACMLMISPIADPGTDVQLEFRGLMTQGACSGGAAPTPFSPSPALVR
jgi:Flp pilus assembly protein TadG